MSFAIRVENLGKRYQLGATHAGSVRELVNRGWNRLLGRSEPAARPVTLDPEAADRLEGNAFWALRDVSFEVKPGEVVGIIGRNGSGKSTLLKILSQITAPTTGRIELHGRVASLLEVGTGFHPELSGRENVFLNGAILGMTKPEIRRKFDEIVAFAEIEKFIDTPVKRYSSGMYVRLAFAVAAHLEPEILIVDEVLSVGDMAFQKKCLGKMDELSHSQGRTVLFVTHNMALVRALCHSAVYLVQGEIQGVGPTEEILPAYMSREAKTGDEPDSRRLPISSREITITNFYSCDERKKEKKRFRTSDVVCFAVSYEIGHLDPGLRIGLDLVNSATGEILFRSFDDDIELQTRTSGSYHAVCMISSNFLKAGSYFGRLMVGIHNVKWILQGEIQHEIHLEHVDGLNSNYGDSRPGVIMPSIPWSHAATLSN